MNKDKKQTQDNKVNMICNPTEDTEKFDRETSGDKLESKGIYKAHLDPKLENTATDVYYQTECKLPESDVAIPTYDSVVEAKEWVDDENKK